MIDKEKEYPPPMGEAPSSMMRMPTTKLCFEIQLVPYSRPRRYNLVQYPNKLYLTDWIRRMQLHILNYTRN